MATIYNGEKLPDYEEELMMGYALDVGSTNPREVLFIAQEFEE
jgi:hypothetical protein